MTAFPLLLLTGCSGDLSALDPQGPFSAAIARLWWVMFAGAAAIFLLVMVLFGLALFRPRLLNGISPRTLTVGGGLFFPLPVLFLLVLYSAMEGEVLIGNSEAGEEPIRVTAEGQMWQWRFHYPDPDSGVTSLNVLHIPVGRVVEVTTLSRDVIHSFWVPRLGGKLDATPGHSPSINIQADQTGTYGGVCAEYCGTGHSGMSFVVEAHEPDAWRAVIEDLSNAGAGS